MIETVELKTLEDFEALKAGNIVAVEWRRDVNLDKRGRNKTRFATYKIDRNKSDTEEIILQKSGNIYFNYKMFLEPAENGVSNCRAITLIRAVDA